jgi:aminopeptidase N
MREHIPQTIYLKDYTPPDFLIETIELTFELDEENTRVTSRMRVYRNPHATTNPKNLELDGEQLMLDSIRLNQRELHADDYTLTEENLLIPEVPDHPFDLEIVTRINPKANTALEGLYLSNGMFCTQCEAQGFRRITFFPDRPDVMTQYTTTIVADESRYPILLSNGNRLATGKLNDGRHWVKWQDPFRKPCYLFALVAGNLQCLEDGYVTGSGRTITLQIFVEQHDLDKCEHAMQSLKHAMRWDEEQFGREYDLDLYMIVAVSHFNMGAMENKGLNIFNTKYVLARPDTATDADYEHIEGVIGHEYFHNWTGNRITCRDWFQLSLKEGLTVFRDQEFSASRTSPAIQRIDEVNQLRTRQFLEDAGPLAHPVRPESYIEINNFYTLTVYEKGAEVVRMIQTLLGQEAFRKGTDLYFQRHDGQAVTCDDFVQCMEDANGVDLSQFRRWYSQAGTPELHVSTEYRATDSSLELTVKQTCPPTPGQEIKEPFQIPLAIGLLAPDGSELPLQLADETQPFPDTTRILTIQEAEQCFRFIHLPRPPVLSVLRNFSAPVKLHLPRSFAELAFLLAHDPDPFNRWDAGQRLATTIMLELVQQWGEQPSRPLFINHHLLEAFHQLVTRDWQDWSYLALLLTLPSEEYVSDSMDVIDPDAVHAVRQWLKRALAEALTNDFLRLYQTHHREESGCSDREARGHRRLKNICLSYLSELDAESSQEIRLRQFRKARNMTDQIAALSCIVNTDHSKRETCLDEFYQKWQNEPLVIDKWFSLQATCQRPDTLARVKELFKHPAFDLKNPNRVRALIGAFCQSNPINFHAKDGSGYQFLTDQVTQLNALNPQIAARMLTAMTAWRRYDSQRQQLMNEQFQRIIETPNISRDVYEVAAKSLSYMT